MKTLILFGLLVLSFVIGFIPMKCIWKYKGRNHRSRTYKIVIGILSCFAAGVFMATCLMDLLPETREALEVHLHDNELLHEYPVAEFIMICGLVMMLTVEQAVLTYQERQGKILNENSTSERKGLLADNDEFKVGYKTTKFDSDNDSGNGRSDDSETNKDFENSLSMAVRTSESDNSTLRSLLLLTALSLHSIFEGLAVGLQKSSSEVLKVFLGLSIHKVILAFSLGTTLSQSKLSFWAQIRSLLTFALASPIGIAIGLIIMEYGKGESSSLAEGILQGIACGTFLYVTFFEILQNELGNPDVRMLKTLFLVIGFLVMSGLFLIHDHSDEPNNIHNGSHIESH